MSRSPGILALGAARTGTSLLSAVLGAHPQIAMLDEDIYGAARRMIGGKIPANKLGLPNQIHPTRRRSPFYGLLRLNGYLRKHLGYKVPSSYLSIADYAEFFDLKIVCIVRNPVRAVDSIVSREQFSRSDAIDLLRRCFDTIDVILADPALDVSIISFDRMVTDAEAQCRSLCDWLGIEFDPAMLQAPERNRRYPAQSFDTGKADAGVGEAVADDLEDLVRRWQVYLKQAF